MVNGEQGSPDCNIKSHQVNQLDSTATGDDLADGKKYMGQTWQRVYGGELSTVQEFKEKCHGHPGHVAEPNGLRRGGGANIYPRLGSGGEWG